MKKPKFPYFWTFFVIFVVAMVVFWICVNNYVKKCLVKYENSQPEYTMNRIIENIANGSIDDLMDFKSSLNRFEDGNIYKEKYISEVKGAELTFEKSAKSYDAMAPEYNVYKGDDVVAKVVLRQTSQHDLMFILTIQDWAVESVEPVYELGDKSVDITVPDSYAVFINGKKAEATELVQKDIQLDEFKYVAEYVDVPTLVEYAVEGFYEEPEIEIKDNNGEDVEFDISKDGIVVINSFETEDISDEMYDFCIANAHQYTNFFSRDIPGCTESIDCIRNLFPAGSYFLELAETYRNNDMWTYSAHYTPEFVNDSVTNYTIYSDDFFSCDIHFEKHMVLKLNGELRVDVINIRYYYVKLDGKWYIADMLTLLDE